VVGPEVVADCTIVGKAAQQAHMVAVPGMRQDHRGAAQPGHAQQLARLPHRLVP
jgi:hypothetical protein